jgi:hypothetical protein
MQCIMIVMRWILDYDDNVKLNTFLAAGEIRFRFGFPKSFQQVSSFKGSDELFKMPYSCDTNFVMKDA